MSPKPWGCPECGWLESWVEDSARDEDGYMVRLRRCAQCRATWPTEERPISRDVYYARKDSGNRDARRRWWRSTKRRCCGRIFHGSNFGRHQRTLKHQRTNGHASPARQSTGEHARVLDLRDHVEHATHSQRGE